MCSKDPVKDMFDLGGDGLQPVLCSNRDPIKHKSDLGWNGFQRFENEFSKKTVLLVS